MCVYKFSDNLIVKLFPKFFLMEQFKFALEKLQNNFTYTLYGLVPCFIMSSHFAST